MNITKFTLKGFRNIGDTTISLKPITALVSLNSYGKSNLIMALDFAISFMHANKEDRRRMMSNESLIPLNVNLAYDNFEFSFTGVATINDKFYLLEYGFSFEWAKENEAGCHILSEYLNVKEQLPRKRFTPLFTRDREDVKIRPSAESRCNTKFSSDIDDLTLVLDLLSIQSPEFLKPYITEIKNVRSFLDQKMDATAVYQKIPQIMFQDAGGMKFMSENIPYTLYMLQQKEPIIYERLIDVFLSLFPNIVGVEVTVSDTSKDMKILGNDSGPVPFTISSKIYSLWVRDRNINQPLEFRFLSAGAKRVLMQLVHVVTASLGGVSVVGLEEPENSIHPSLFHGFLESLKSFAGDMKIIITSHSPYVIQYMDLDGIYIGIPSDDGVARFRKFASDAKIENLVNDAEDSDTLVGNYIFELLSGNESEINILESYLEASDGSR